MGTQHPTAATIHRCSRQWAVWAALAVPACLATSAEGAPPSAEDFSRPPAISGVQLSPSGQRLALLVPSPEGRKRLAVMDLPPSTSPRVVASFRDADIGNFGWVNDDRLIYEAVDFSDGPTVRQYGAGTFAVDHDGKNSRHLIAWRGFEIKEATHIVSRVLDYHWDWDGTMDNGSDDVWVHKNMRDGRGEFIGRSLASLNTRTGLLRTVQIPDLDHVHRWLIGKNGEPEVVQTHWEGRSKLYWREASDKPWTLLQDSASYREDVWTPLYMDGHEQLVVRASPKNESALFAFNLKTRRLDPDPLVAVKGFDLNATLRRDSRTHQVLGVQFLTDSAQSYWFDDGMDSIQRTIDASLPAGRSNKIICGRCSASRFFVIQSRSDTVPGEYYLFDRQEKRLEPIGASRPWIAEASQGQRSFHRIAARDGLELPVYVTHPSGTQRTDKLPAVLLVHGGPWVRGSDRGWDEEAQFLASRGYRVIEPEFRGSTGYGDKLFSAGIKQWGQSMQDDLADAVQWAAKQGLIDEQRVCIMGASYGGYAALMGPIRHPKTYRCAISFAGVTDIELRYNAWGSDLGDQVRRYTLPMLMGDPEADRDKIRSVSPLLRAGEIKVPVLLVQGAKDRRVPIEHADKFAKAAKAAGVNVDYKIYDLEGHGWVIPADKADYYRRVEAFLAKHLTAAP
ncbi:alpha/beta fold hydrolase [Ideonella sp. DXS29W]|uniref:Alpha/beta fold hydrolase n=1 Tax=Ideonella lacteola TaxID=2984193 RepID=A0ABU9BWC5_9BURK